MDRVQRSRAKGAKMPPNTLYCGRPTRRGNPFHIYRNALGDGFIIQHYDRAWLDRWNLAPVEMPEATNTHVWVATMREARTSAVRLYAEMLDRHPAIRDAILAECRGHEHLACWCSLDGACHVDYLLECLAE